MPNLARLARLSQIVEAVPVNRFRMSVFYVRGQMCACGAAGLDPEFNAASYKLTSDRIIARQPVYDDRLFGWDAVKHFFDVSDDTATFLFTPFGYVAFTPEAVAAITPLIVGERIRKYVMESA